jgi:hypothetical protein
MPTEPFPTIESIPLLQIRPHPPVPSPKMGEGEPDQSPSPALGEGFRVRAAKLGCTPHNLNEDGSKEALHFERV